MLFQNNFPLPKRRATNQVKAGSDAKLFWGTALADVATDTAPFPLISAREAQRTGRRDPVRRSLPADVQDMLPLHAATVGISTVEYVFSAYLFVLTRMTGAVGACAILRVPGEEAGPVPVFARPDPDRSFAVFAQSVRDRITEGLDHDGYGLDDIAEVSGVVPHFGFTWIAHDSARGAPTAAKMAQALALELVCLAGPDGLDLMVSHADNPVAAERASILVDHVVDLLGRKTLPESGPLKTIGLRGPEIATTPRPDAGAAAGVSLSQAVSEIAAANPEATAISETGQNWSYGALERDVTRLAEALAEAGVGAGTRIALRIPRSGALIVGMLAVNRLDGIFAIFDPEYPEPRLAAMDAVFQAELVLQPSSEPARGIALTQGRLDIRPGTGTASDHAPAAARYALFTSGTTGQPKCVLASGEGLISFLFQHIVNHGAGPDTRTALIGGLGHDPFLRDVFVPLMSGGALHLPPAGFRQDPRLLADWLRDRAITILHMTPQMSKLIRLGANGHGFPALKHLFWGGDVLASADAEAFLALAPNATGNVIYGTTETPQAASMMRLETPLAWTSCLIGTGVNGRVLRLEVDGRPCGYGEPGEIMVEGDDLALGYFDAKEGLKPFGRGVGATRFETRDLGFYLASGDVAFIGRADQQVKIRGFRVEPAEIVKLLEAQSGVVRAVVIAEPGPTGENRLVGYVEGEAAREDRLIEACRRELPDYMVPAGIVTLAQLPITSNGKLDRAALPSLDARAAELGDEDLPHGPKEQAVFDALTSVLNRTHVPMSKSVREIGVDSLSYLNVVLEFEKLLGGLPDNWDRMPLREIAQAETEQQRWPSVESQIPLRALAISIVAAEHLGLMPSISATPALFFLAGHSFGRFQVPTMLRRETAGTVLHLVGLIALPTLLYTLLLQIVFGPFTPITWVMLGNFAGPAVADGFTYWYIDVLVQNLLILALLFSLPAFRRRYAEHPFVTTVAFFASVYLARLILPVFWDTEPLFNRIPHMTMWMMALGWALASANDLREQRVVAVMGVAVLAVEYFVFGNSYAVMLIAFVVMLVMPRILLPYPVNVGVALVAAASLFIYLTHGQFATVVQKVSILLGGPEQMPLVETLVALVGGVVVYRVWERATGLVIRQWRRLSGRLGLGGSAPATGRSNSSSGTGLARGRLDV